MAATIPVRFSATVVDALSTEASTNSYAIVDPATTIATMDTAFATWLTNLDAVLDTQIIKGSWHVMPALPGGLKGSPAAGSKVEFTGVLNLSNTVNSRRYGQVLPGVAAAVLSGGKIDLANASITTLLTQLTSAIGGGTFTNPYVQALSALVDAIISFRERRKQLQRSSFER